MIKKITKSLSDFFYNYLTKEVMAPRPYYSNFQELSDQIQPSDVLLVEGRNRISRIIKNITHSPWTHAALFIGRPSEIQDEKLLKLIHPYHSDIDDTPLVIESIVGRGTLVAPLKNYHLEHLRICRARNLPKEDAKKVVSFALNRLGRPYNIRQILDLWRFLSSSKFFSWRWQSTLFEYNPGQATQDICSTMIAEAFGSIHYPILPLIQENTEKNLELIQRNPKLYAPCDFDYSPYFNIIKYPILPLDNPGSFRDLPWHPERIYSNDHQGIYHANKDLPDSQNN